MNNIVRGLAAAAVFTSCGLAAQAATPVPHAHVIHPGDAVFAVKYTPATERTGCAHGKHWVRSYKRKDGRVVNGYCR